jgi:DNA-binding ferritin-like protein
MRRWLDKPKKSETTHRESPDGYSTADLFTQVSRALDTDLWFLEAHLQGR